MNILITGASGALGCNLVENLESENDPGRKEQAGHLF